MIRANVAGVAQSTARKRFTPTKLLPKPQREMPAVYGIDSELPADRQPARGRGTLLRRRRGRRAAPVCVLGQAAKTDLFGPQEAVGQYVKVNEQWFRVIGVAGATAHGADATSPACPTQDRNNIIYVPLNAGDLPPRGLLAAG